MSSFRFAVVQVSLAGAAVLLCLAAATQWAAAMLAYQPALGAPAIDLLGRQALRALEALHLVARLRRPGAGRLCPRRCARRPGRRPQRRTRHRGSRPAGRPSACPHFRFNAFYPEDAVPDIDEDRYRLIVGGLIENKQPWSLEQLYALPQETQIARLICVEGWSAIGKWTGVPLRGFLERIGADLTAKYVHFTCSDGYSSSIDMPTALHPQTQMTLRFDDQILPTKFGFPMRIRIATKLEFKNPKHVIGMAVLNNYTGGYWEDQGYNWFSGV